MSAKKFLIRMMGKSLALIQIIITLIVARIKIIGLRSERQN